MGEIIRVVQLLCDCEMRWSSTCNMIDRVMELYPVNLFPALMLVMMLTELHPCSLYKIFFSSL